jgi:hypothetical protein
MLVAAAHLPTEGTYIPLSPRPKVKRKLPDVRDYPKAVHVPAPFTFFTNPLVLPAGYGTPCFDVEHAPMPILRVTNGGWLIVTLEFDPDTVEGFEETLAWTRRAREKKSKIELVDAELARYSDYRGYTTIFSGRRSVHTSFIFAMDHLEIAPSSRTWGERLRHMQHDAAVMARAHEVYWDRVREIFDRVVRPSLPADEKLRSVTQWRRAPWGIRVLEEDSPLGIPAQTEVPQIVLAEKIRSRAAPGAQEAIVPQTFTVLHSIKALGIRKPWSTTGHSVGSEMFQEARELFRKAFGEYPRLEQQACPAGEWVFWFSNHAGDRTPSTVARGEHRTLKICGNGHALTGPYRLPEGLSAQELGDYLALGRVCGRTLRCPARRVTLACGLARAR